MKTWRERIAEAEARAARDWWGARLVRTLRQSADDYHFPFTGEDSDAFVRMGPDSRGLPVCPAAEVTEAYGLSWHSVLFELGTRMMFAVNARNLPRATRLLGEIEDMALQLKREQA